MYVSSMYTLKACRGSCRRDFEQQTACAFLVMVAPPHVAYQKPITNNCTEPHVSLSRNFRYTAFPPYQFVCLLLVLHARFWTDIHRTAITHGPRLDGGGSRGSEPRSDKNAQGSVWWCGRWCHAGADRYVEPVRKDKETCRYVH